MWSGFSLLINSQSFSFPVHRRKVGHSRKDRTWRAFWEPSAESRQDQAMDREHQKSHRGSHPTKPKSVHACSKFFLSWSLSLSRLTLDLSIDSLSVPYLSSLTWLSYLSVLLFPNLGLLSLNNTCTVFGHTNNWKKTFWFPNLFFFSRPLKLYFTFHKKRKRNDRPLW